MHNFCTLFDANYLPRALVLHRSLVEAGEDFTLHAICMDETAHRVLSTMRPPHLIPVSLEEFESPALRAVKDGRTRGEYCWTCTPHAVRHLLDAVGVAEATYLDADLRFFGPPGSLIAEMHAAGASVLITPHRYTPRYDQSAKSGIYCVQFVTFRRDERGLRALQWWQDRCIEWCYARFEDGRFGDQKYLDDWPVRFEGVHVLEHLGGGVAPWNVQQYRLRERDGRLYVDEVPLVFYHFQDYRYFDDGTSDPGQYRLAPEVVELLYRPYEAALQQAHEEIAAIEPGFTHGWSQTPPSWRRAVRSVKRVLRG